MSRARAWSGVIVAAVLALGAAGAGAQGFSQKGADSPGTRSARSDCEGEARRRGYVVLATGNYQQYREGWSIDMRVRDSRGRESTGSCFVETGSGDVSLYGFAWGNDSGGSNSFEFNCASIDTKYRECQLPVDGRARVVKRFSEAKCDEGRGWGQRGDRVWVDHGCRARFEVVRGGSGGGSGGNGRVDCRSQSGRYAECRIDRGYVGRLERDYSGGRCSQGNWGSSDGLVWVRNGCQGRFALQRREWWRQRRRRRESRAAAAGRDAVPQRGASPRHGCAQRGQCAPARVVLGDVRRGFLPRFVDPCPVPLLSGFEPRRSVALNQRRRFVLAPHRQLQACHSIE